MIVGYYFNLLYVLLDSIFDSMMLAYTCLY